MIRLLDAYEVPSSSRRFTKVATNLKKVASLTIFFSLTSGRRGQGQRLATGNAIVQCVRVARSSEISQSSFSSREVRPGL